MGCAVEVDVSCVKGEWYVGPLCLNDWPGEGYMIDPSIVVFFYRFVSNLELDPPVIM
jgi:hypothetical protein